MRYRSRPSKRLRRIALACALACALVLSAAACAPSPFLTDDEVSARVPEALVWNNLMPDAPMRAHAVLRAVVGNRTEDTLVLASGAEGIVTRVYDGAILRRFSVDLFVADARSDGLRIPPRDSVDVSFRSLRQGFEPIDFGLDRDLRLSVAARTPDGRVLRIDSAPVVGMNAR
jgi:hypothetical protein